jgi:hypothetical protein
VITYLASPYTPVAGESIQDRVDAACKAAAKLMADGPVFSPIAHSHYIADHLEESLRLDHEFWMQQDLAILRHCGRLVVLKLPGYDRSLGVKREISEAICLGIPVEFIDP